MSHLQISQTPLPYFPLQLTVVGLIRIGIASLGYRGWQCPFPDCGNDFEGRRDVIKHVTEDHTSEEIELFEGAGDFWTFVMVFLRKVKKWPVIEEILPGRADQGAISASPNDKDTAVEAWVTGGERLTSTELGEYRVLGEFPLDNLIHCHRTHTQPGPLMTTSKPGMLEEDLHAEPMLLDHDSDPTLERTTEPET
jgi:hypothetical protein